MYMLPHHPHPNENHGAPADIISLCKTVIAHNEEESLPRVLAVADVQHFLEDSHPRRHEEGKRQDADAHEPRREGGICRVIALLLKGVHKEGGAA